MVRHHRIHAERFCVRDLRVRRNAVVDGHDQSDPVLLHCVDRVAVQTVSFPLPARQKERHVCTEPLESVGQDRRCADPVGIVVAVHADPFPRADRGADAPDRAVHVRKPERIGKILRLRMQICRDRSVVNKSAPHEHGGKRSCKPETVLYGFYRGVRNVPVASRKVFHTAQKRAAENNPQPGCVLTARSRQCLLRSQALRRSAAP